MKPFAHRKSYTNLYKRFVVRYYENCKQKSKRLVARLFCLAPTTVRLWIKSKAELLSEKCVLTKRRNSKTNNKHKGAIFEDAEAELYKWFSEQRDNNLAMTTDGIINKMRELLKVMHPDEELIFKYSRGWFQNFMKRYNLSYRRISTSGRDLPKNCFQIIKDFLNEIKTSIDKNGKNLF
jgi:transposase